MPVVLWFLLLVPAALASPARATVPALMNYQAYLTSSSGSPRSGNFPMAFGVYAASTGGAPLWAEAYSSVTVTEGSFNVLLGSHTPLPDSVFTGAERWLQTTIQDTVLVPRRPLVTMPYSFRANNASWAGSAGLATRALTAGWADTAGHVVFADSAIAAAYADTAGYSPGTWSLAVNAQNDSILYHVPGAVGIGTANPLTPYPAKLKVVGEAGAIGGWFVAGQGGPPALAAFQTSGFGEAVYIYRPGDEYHTALVVTNVNEPGVVTFAVAADGTVTCRKLWETEPPPPSATPQPIPDALDKIDQLRGGRVPARGASPALGSAHETSGALARRKFLDPSRCPSWCG